MKKIQKTYHYKFDKNYKPIILTALVILNVLMLKKTKKNSRRTGFFWKRTRSPWQL